MEEEKLWCGACETSKVASDFNWKNKAHGVRQGFCRLCKKQYQGAWYQRHRAAHIKRVGDTKAAQKQENRKLIIEYLQHHQCVDCGNADILVLDFDHVKGKKTANVCDLIARGATWERILVEIAKCDVRCANCHRRQTNIRSGHFKWLWLQEAVL
jgi:hypothetical protein